MAQAIPLRSMSAVAPELQQQTIGLFLRRVMPLLGVMSPIAYLAAYGLSYRQPTVVKDFGVSNTMNGFINVLPWAVTAVALWWVPRHSEQVQEKTWHIVILVAIGAACLVGSVVVPGNAPKFALLCVAAACVFAAQPIFWTLPSSFLSGASPAAGLAVINNKGFS